MKIQACRNRPVGDPHRKAWGTAKLPGRQTLVWAGPLFFRVVR